MQINFEKIKLELTNNLRIIILKAGTEAINFTKDNFVKQGFRDIVTTPWPKRKNDTKKDSTRGILMKTGRLKRSIRLIKMTSSSVTIGTDVPYAQAHNEGYKGIVTIPEHTRMLTKKQKVSTGKFTKTGKERMITAKIYAGETTVRQHTRRLNLPQRQFMGPSKSLNYRIQQIIQKEIKAIFK